MSWKKPLSMVVIAAFFGFAGAQIGMSNAKPAPAQDIELPETINALLQQRSDLTSAQKSAIATINDSFTVQHNHLLANLMVARAHLGDAFSVNMTLSAPTKEAVGSMDDAVGDIQIQTINYIIDVRKILTPIQRRDFDAKIIAILMREAT